MRSPVSGTRLQLSHTLRPAQHLAMHAHLRGDMVWRHTMESVTTSPKKPHETAQEVKSSEVFRLCLPCGGVHVLAVSSTTMANETRTWSNEEPGSPLGCLFLQLQKDGKQQCHHHVGQCDPGDFRVYHDPRSFSCTVPA